MPREYYAKEIVKLFEGLSGKVLIPRSAVGRDEEIKLIKESAENYIRYKNTYLKSV